MLRLATDELNKTLPGYATSENKTQTFISAFLSENSVLDELNVKLKKIEDRVQEALQNALKVSLESPMHLFITNSMIYL